MSNNPAKNTFLGAEGEDGGILCLIRILLPACNLPGASLPRSLPQLSFAAQRQEELASGEEWGP